MKIEADEKTLKFLRQEQNRPVIGKILEILEAVSDQTMVWVRDGAEPGIARDDAITAAKAYKDFAKQLRELTVSTPGLPCGLQGIS